MSLENIPDLIRIESLSNDEMNEKMVEQTHAVYSHEEAYGPCFTLEITIDAPPSDIYEYLIDPLMISEWSYGLRNGLETQKSNESSTRSFMFTNQCDEQATVYCQISSHRSVMTIDYQWAEKTIENITSTEFLRILPATNALNRTGSVLLWTSCLYPGSIKFGTEIRTLKELGITDQWKQTSVQRRIELNNIKCIQQHRHPQGSDQ